ncbi:hypothetical protein [Agarivorans sp. Alg241-V36]|nr:hypothetical protein [Agarivorans sp. Alg241-V36]
MNVIDTRISDVIIVEPKALGDERGLLSAFQSELYKTLSIVD